MKRHASFTRFPLYIPTRFLYSVPVALLESQLASLLIYAVF